MKLGDICKNHTSNRKTQVQAAASKAYIRRLQSTPRTLNARSAYTLLLGLAPLVLVLASALPIYASSKKVLCGSIRQEYAYYFPEKGPVQPRPAVLLLHGAGDLAENMIAAWHELAAKEGIVLLAPQLPRDLGYEDHAPEVFRCVAEDAAKFASIDPDRIYLFGNSMGGYLAYDGAMFESRYFAAAAVHAMRIADDYAGIVSKAERKTPIAIYIGDRDQFFDEPSVRKTRDLLRSNGFPVRYMKLLGHDHDYYAVADEVNADAWQFFKEHPLPPTSR